MTSAELLPIFREQFPEFDLIIDAVVLKYLTTASVIHALCELATVHLAAHLITINAESGLGGTGASVDGGGSAREVLSDAGKSINASYKSVSEKDGDSFYAATAYGRMYIILRDACPGRGFSVRVA